MDTHALARVQQMLAEFKKLEPVEVAEPTIFSVGGKGYYENPTTDILAYFLDDKAAHGLGALVMDALFDALSDKVTVDDLDHTLIQPPEREVQTKNGKRVDLLLESEQWVMVIENKIYHDKINPFAEYEKFVFKQYPERFQGKIPLFVILSPDGKVPTKCHRWKGIAYNDFIRLLKEKLANYFLEQPINKWFILLREFLLHLESVMSQPQVSLDTLNFVLDNLQQIQQIQETKSRTIQLYQQSLQQQLQIELDVVLESKVVHWHGYPAIRFKYPEWTQDTDVVLFLDGREGKSFCINYYCSAIDNDEARKVADMHLREQDCRSVWNEVSGTCRCYKARFDEFSLDYMRQKLAQKLQLMAKFEHAIRPTIKIPKGAES
ncbi:PDDEXK-like family protein [Shewanella xiamenensis]|uniref:PDDEXK-like family protein n=1 Tax=Shewanella xiamenensis TaxID=332186 RepID=UPI0004DACD33|nr:PD-(D/E)XK nuclease family protein [Shewanella xiamenensis]KEK29612.1 hypothetical protein SXM_0081 [Shewanella xiamenensis]